MADVGGVACSLVQGSSAGLKQGVITWQVPGISGTGALLTGFQDGEFSFSCVLYDTHANVVAWKTAIEALQGSIVSIVDDQGSTHTNCLITSITPLDRRAAINGGGGYDTRGALVVSGVLT